LSREEIEEFAQAHESFTLVMKSGNRYPVMSRDHFGFPPPQGTLIVFDDEISYKRFKIANIKSLKSGVSELVS